MASIINHFGWVPDSDGLDRFIYGQRTRRQGTLYTGEDIEANFAADMKRLRRGDDNADVYPWRMLRAIIPDSFFKTDTRTGGDRLLSLDQGDVGSCFLPGTPVLMGSGDTAPIDRIGKGDIVVGHDGQRRPVEEVLSHEHDGGFVTLTTSNGTTTCTSDHLFVASINGEPRWVPARDLSRGSLVKSMADHESFDAGEFSTITSVVHTTGRMTVHNIEVADSHSYHVNGLAAHNCVGNAEARALLYRIVADIARNGDAETWPGAAPAADALYALSRDVSGQLGGGDGSTNAWMLKAVTEVGVPLMEKIGSYDLRTYSANRCRDWAKRGVPEAVKDAARKHKVLKAVRIKSVDDLWTFCGTWGAVNCCSMWGGTSRREVGGIMRRSGTWAHSMNLAGRRTWKNQRQFCIHQSWGSNWAENCPVNCIEPFDLPWGAFWVTDDDIAWILTRGGGEIVALVDWDGVPSTPDFVFGLAG